MISVIVPVYNVEQYIEESLNSILNQTYTDIEVICVDDMSQDNSLQILKDMAAQDSRVYVYESTVHGHCGGARNIGLSHAKGKYVYFFDCDDILQQDALEILVTAAEEDELDITYFDGNVKYDTKSDGFQIESECYNYCGVRDTVCSGELFFLDLLKHHKMYYVVWLQMYRTSFLEALQMKYNVGFPHEDGNWSFKVMLSATRVRRVPKSFYQRRVRSGSVTTVKYSIANIQGMAASLQGMQHFCRCCYKGKYQRKTIFQMLRHTEGYRRNLERIFFSLEKKEKHSCFTDEYLLNLGIAQQLRVLDEIRRVFGNIGFKFFYLYRSLYLRWQWFSYLQK